MTAKHQDRTTGASAARTGGTLAPFFSAWYGKVWILGVTAVAASVAIYLSRQAFIDAYRSAHETVLGRLGLGLVPLALWAAFFLWAIVKRRSLFGRPRLWLASVGVVALGLGVMSYFQPVDGRWAWFTLDGEVSLAGRLGEAVVGSVGWLGVFRLAGIFVLTLWVAAPPLAADIARFALRATYSGYVLAALGVRNLVQLYRARREARQAQLAPGDISGEPNMPPEVLSPYTRERRAEPQEVDVEMLGRALVDEPSPLEPLVGLGDGGFDDDDLDDTEELEESSTKVNRFWGDSDGESDGSAAGETWKKPSTDLLLDGDEGGISEEEMRSTAETIRRTLSEYGVEVDVGQIKPGPAVTMYGLVPGWIRRYKQVKQQDENGRPVLDEAGKPVIAREETKTRVKVDNILSREKDLALALKTPSIRIETPAMGKSLVGIEVPNPNPSLVTLRAVMESPEFIKLRAKAHLPVALGKGSGGETAVIDLAKMPHLLIAGATGSGKSVCINAIISCLIMERSPAEMRLLLIDPKRVELTPYNGIPHLLTPVVVETDQVVGLLKGLIGEMLDRYRRMEEVGVRNIDAYNRKVSEKMPLLVVAVDELADLMMSAAFDIEQSLCRLAQLGRATGIHLIIATQRPSVDVVTGLIKANFPSRISFGVTSQVDSRTILDTAGADKLLGRGDMLYLPLEASRPARIQGVFISDHEIESLVSFWQTTPWASIPRIAMRPASSGTGGDTRNPADSSSGSADELMDNAILLAKSYNKLSTSLLQRRLRIGYPRAARLIDELEEQGIVGPGDGAKSRDVIMTKT
ncbi:MAG: DNA translocase FtsK [Chloroflexi bacterium]|nr:DNA translocase FtsK [Chloroflexota bacterium]